MSQIVEVLNEILNLLNQASMYLRNGQVIYAYRQVGYLRAAFDLSLDSDGSKLRSVNLIMTRLKKGEQIDAHDEIKSLIDKCEKIRKALILGEKNV